MIILNKIDVFGILEQFFDDKNNCAILHLDSGSEIMVEEKPSFHNNFMIIYLKDTNIHKKEILEKCYVPYENISYIIATTFENISLRMENYMNNVSS